MSGNGRTRGIGAPAAARPASWRPPPMSSRPAPPFLPFASRAGVKGGEAAGEARSPLTPARLATPPWERRLMKQPLHQRLGADLPSLPCNAATRATPPRGAGAPPPHARRPRAAPAGRCARPRHVVKPGAGLREGSMDYRYLGRSGLRVSALTMGTMTFGGGGNFAKVGASDLDEARRLIDLCLDAGVNLLDTANVYSHGRLGGDHRRRPLAGKRARRPDRLQGPLPHRRGPERRGPVALAHPAPGRGEPEAAPDRRHRHPLPARMGRDDAARRDARRARHPGRPGQDPLRRLPRTTPAGT